MLRCRIGLFSEAASTTQHACCRIAQAQRLFNDTKTLLGCCRVDIAASDAASRRTQQRSVSTAAAQSLQFTVSRMRSIAVAVLLCGCVQLAAAQKLTGNLTSGITCTTDATNPFGSGCPKGEGCCRETNTCVKISSCADFAKVCPPSTCGKDLSFSEVTCAADVTKVFRSPKQLKCYESRDTTCQTNETAMVVACRSAAGSLGAQMVVLLFAASLALVFLI